MSLRRGCRGQRPPASRARGRSPRTILGAGGSARRQIKKAAHTRPQEHEGAALELSLNGHRIDRAQPLPITRKEHLVATLAEDRVWVGVLAIPGTGMSTDWAPPYCTGLPIYPQQTDPLPTPGTTGQRGIATGPDDAGWLVVAIADEQIVAGAKREVPIAPETWIEGNLGPLRTIRPGPPNKALADIRAAIGAVVDHPCAIVGPDFMAYPISAPAWVTGRVRPFVAQPTMSFAIP